MKWRSMTYVLKVQGTDDENYIDRLWLAYYLLYCHIDNEEAVAFLFEEELKDREQNSFQGIGSTLQILTHLIRKYNGDGKYAGLLERAKNANFDCACGYDPDGQFRTLRLFKDILEACFEVTANHSKAAAGLWKWAKTELQKMPQTDANCILKDFAEHYVDKEKLRKYGLMWNSFARKPKCISMEEIRDIPIPPEDRVFFYDERDKTLYATKMEEVVTCILKLEPWDQVDACVFNREMEWVLAVTHEDALLFLEENAK